MSLAAADLDPIAALRWLRDMGLEDEALESPVNRYAAVEAAPARARSDARPAEAPVGTRTPSPTTPLAPSPRAEGAAVESARALAAQARTLDELRAAIEGFDGCSLKAGATRLVFADGNPEAPLMLVGEAPGRDEDLQGKPFVGVSGQLLDRILAAIGRDRSSVYITNVLPWRPPDNREPALAEAAICLPFLIRHIELARPKVVMALGATAARHLLDTSEGITRLRGKWTSLKAGGHECAAVATFHPAALLRNPINKRYVWRDMLSVAERLSQTG